MGATTALALATYGVRVQVVNRYNWTANTPRAHITNQRAMEVLRDLGLEDDARRQATPWEWMGDTLFTTSLAGPEIARLRTWGTGDARIGDYLQASPCPMLDLPQNKMEPMLVRHAAARGAVFSFNTEYLGHEQDGDGVTVSLRDVLSGREYAVRARYLVGADGARSKVMDDAGLELRGQLARAATAYVLFRADLSRYAAHRPSILYWIATSNAAFGEIGLGLLRAIEPWNQWIAGWGFDMEKGEPDFSPEEIRRKVRILVGDPDLEIEIDNASVWYVNQAHAPVYSKGRVFCGGDAVHRHPPSSGLGSNTCMQDAFNLAWKLAFVLRGHAGTGLLDSYSLERAPVGAQIVARANQSRLDYGPLNQCLREPGAADPVAAGLARLASPDAEGVARRAALAEALRLKNYEFNAQGVELNQRYASAAVIADRDADLETWARDPQLHAQASTRPGAKLPHAWLVGGDGRRVSTLDVVGRGRFTLVTGLAGQAWKAAAAAMDLPFLRTVVIGEPGALDSYCAWQALREIEESGALLVRPDGIVAWRRHSGEGLDVASAGAVLDTALASLLDRAR
ncbi:MAG: 2,4-dichlorophenol 6-monooxygenase [Bordetella sp. SCN 67-23]|nr:FAD-dependent monooxygenase [Burkholderiales bacterium]ODS69176.1 MAG: 2,4-dichlorophenol 6-monooxygenase [Bordetella sp. SCN 67-23]OJW90631.1 MAG: 2,4-dichlorophenol 6-monooxygenase [Burkholderiales bacterium 67-32]